MSYIKDLDFCDYFENKPPYKYGYKKLLAVGWLDEEVPVPRGPLPAGFLEKLTRLFDGRHEFLYYCGHHDCCYCDHWEGQGQAFIPGKDVVYACPKGILHYIEAHGYCPPREFVEVVMKYDGELEGTEYLERLKSIDERLYWMLYRHDFQAYKKGIDRDKMQYPWTEEWEEGRRKEEAEEYARMSEYEKARLARSQIKLSHNELVEALKKRFQRNF